MVCDFYYDEPFGAKKNKKILITCIYIYVYRMIKIVVPCTRGRNSRAFEPFYFFCENPFTPTFLRWLTSTMYVIISSLSDVKNALPSLPLPSSGKNGRRDVVVLLFLVNKGKFRFRPDFWPHDIIIITTEIGKIGNDCQILYNRSTNVSLYTRFR